MDFVLTYGKGRQAVTDTDQSRLSQSDAELEHSRAQRTPEGQTAPGGLEKLKL